MSISFGSARLLRYIVVSASKFSETAVINVSESEFTFKAIDPSRTALLVVTIPRESATAFNVNGSEQLVVNLDDLSKVFRSAERDDMVTLSWTQSTLSVSFERRGFARTFTLPLATSAEEIPEIEIEYPNTYILSPLLLHDCISGLEDVGEVLRVEGREDEIKLRAESELGEAEVVLSKERGGIEESDVREPGFSVGYSMEFVTNIKPIVKVAEKLTLKIGSELPLYLEFLSHGLLAKYYVAPRAD
ncbi:MAG: hypothetical protein QW780_03615 [Sulfolobales archaeon]